MALLPTLGHTATLKPSGPETPRIPQPTFSPLPVAAALHGERSPVPSAQPGLQLALQHGRLASRTLQPATRPLLSRYRRLSPTLDLHLTLHIAIHSRSPSNPDGVALLNTSQAGRLAAKAGGFFLFFFFNWLETKVLGYSQADSCSYLCHQSGSRECLSIWR